MGKFTPTLAQEKAFEKMIKAVKAAKAAGLVVYAKSNDLVAYTKQADAYIEQDFPGCFGNVTSQIEHLGATVLADSGADDYPAYRSAADEQYYTQD